MLTLLAAPSHPTPSEGCVWEVINYPLSLFYTIPEFMQIKRIRRFLSGSGSWMVYFSSARSKVTYVLPFWDLVRMMTISGFSSSGTSPKLSM